MDTIRRLLGVVFFFGAPVFLIAVACVAVGLRPVFGPIDLENIDRNIMVRLLQFRDFRAFPAPLVAKLSERYDAEFGRRGGKMPEFRFSAAQKRIHAHYESKSKTNGTRFQTNLNLLARAKYFDWMDRFESLARKEQPALMNEVIDDMKWWEDIYMNFLRAAEIPIPSQAELMRQFDEMIESFKTGAAAEDVKRIDRFKKRMAAGFVARAMFTPANWLP